MKLTNLEKYGTNTPSESNLIKDQNKKYFNEKYGVDNPFQAKSVKEKIKQTNLEKYGVDYYYQSENFKEKSKQTCLERYGVENPLQNKEIFDKHQKASFKRKKYKNTDIHYQGTYELDFLDKYYSKIKIENGHSINYIFESKNKVYHSDFYLPDYNLIVEVKSDYIYDLHLETNLEKQKTCLELKYNYIFIINKNYNNFENLININEN